MSSTKVINALKGAFKAASIASLVVSLTFVIAMTSVVEFNFVLAGLVLIAIGLFVFKITDPDSIILPLAVCLCFALMLINFVPGSGFGYVHGMAWLLGCWFGGWRLFWKWKSRKNSNENNFV